jgi:tripartite-type tricarboxylate transporter receptor subunit TctC
MAMFDRAAGIELQHVPYKGAAPAVTDLLGGNVQAMLIGVSTVLPYVNAGRLVPLGVSSLKPSPLAPRLPTIADAAGLPDFEVGNWLGVFAPAGTPPAIVARLNAEINAIMQMPETRTSLAKDGFEPVAANTPAQFGSYVQSEIAKWARVIKDANITAN